jgi:hypothetical protein
MDATQFASALKPQTRVDGKIDLSRWFGQVQIFDPFLAFTRGVFATVGNAGAQTICYKGLRAGSNLS